MAIFTTLENALGISVAVVNKYFSRFIVALLILFVGISIGRLFNRLMHKSLTQLELNKIIKSVIITNSDFEKLIAHLVSYLIYFLTIVLFLVQIGIVKTLFWIIVVLGALFVLLSLLLGVKDMIPNIFAGFFIGKNTKLKIGDKVKIDDVKGEISKFTITDVVLKTKEGIVHFPNTKIKESGMKKIKKNKKRSH